MTRKRYYPENISLKNEFKVRKVETRKQFTETEINYIKFKNWWFGFGVGSVTTGIIYLIMSI